MMTVLLADGSPVAMLVLSIVIGCLSVAMVFGGRHMIKTKSAGARKLEKLWADQDGKIHGGMAVVKGYIMMIGGAGLLVMCVGLFFLSIYILIFGPVNLGAR